MSLHQRIKALEDQVLKPDAEDWDWVLYDTQGELASRLPPGAVPTMPADIFVKPDLSEAIAAQHHGRPPDHRSRVRPRVEDMR